MGSALNGSSRSSWNSPRNWILWSSCIIGGDREEFELYLKDADEEYDEEDIEIMMEEVYDRLDSEGKGYITFDEYFDACYADDSDDEDDSDADDDSDE